MSQGQETLELMNSKYLCETSLDRIGNLTKTQKAETTFQLEKL